VARRRPSFTRRRPRRFEYCEESAPVRLPVSSYSVVGWYRPPASSWVAICASDHHLKTAEVHGQPAWSVISASSRTGYRDLLPPVRLYGADRFDDPHRNRIRRRSTFGQAILQVSPTWALAVIRNVLNTNRGKTPQVARPPGGGRLCRGGDKFSYSSPADHIR